MSSPSGFVYTRTAGTGSAFTATATIATSAGSVTATTSNATTVEGQRHSGQANVTISAYEVTASTDPSVVPGTAVAHTNNFAPVLSLQYTDFGEWTIDASTSAARPLYVGVYGGGKPGIAPSTSVPTTGTATFSGAAVGYVSQPNSTKSVGTLATFHGSLGMTADFAAGTISGNVTNVNAYEIGKTNAASVGTINDIQLRGTITGAAIAGTATSGPAGGTFYNTNGASGQLTGGFFGPSAKEVAGTFALTGGGNNVSVIGSFGASQAVPSDRRVKCDLRREGRWTNGLPRWSWRYIGERSRFVGVLAQEVLADPRFAGAVSTDAAGMMRVDYERLAIFPQNIAAMRAEGEAATRRFIQAEYRSR
ncbi:transferrin-binding protein-like solute binding protein [Novosphingobium sp. MMS21-SN21R]|uniref:transferrin-binding protein-like solute binding protein n=1 Tax=Novosphingobium sp. MMS21-SN21R TaxID=2969298 RepID=UPI002886E356|nr:transferrin-binding protein-like solute binding protein [Novosphingobium sp. MMS21-SN21R]MDT0508386.1 transferrin-binding protein-like solute binding protein [Novosphingobium sp. MMS21-SN21R]